MAESDTTGVDPRYDPRFQRGYVGGPEADASSATSRPQSPAVAQPTRESLAELERRASERTARATPPEYEQFAPEEHPAAAGGLRSEASARSTSPAPRVAEPDVDGHPDGDAASIAWFDESGAASTGSADPWFLGAWALSVVALAGGAALFVTSVMSQDYFGTGTSTNMWLQYAGWTVAPSLVQGGLLGIVGMLVWTGVRHARAQARPAEPRQAGDAA